MAENQDKVTEDSTDRAYENTIKQCKNLFLAKHSDYGASWRILRFPSLVDQIFIKAKRIRSIEEKKTAKINDSIESEFVGLVNYCIIAFIQLEIKPDFNTYTPIHELTARYDKYAQKAKKLMQAKNHDYGEVWKEMYVTSFTDLILVKLLRIRSIIENNGKTSVSEGIEANLYDIINYSVFALIKINQSKS